ncbi:MAG: hypothetical protein IJF36_03480 [Oscillibacter sp.]|nr:hypothetical protein [Oscillibacter sp.]
MDENLYELLKNHSFWHWLPPEGGRYFDACFNMDWERIDHDAHIQSRGRVGYIISGHARLTTERGTVPAGEGAFFGVFQPSRPESRRVEETELWAVTDCTVLWLDADVLTSVCYAACWFHARLIREVDAWFENRREG